MPDEAIERERITRIVSDGFASHGYLPVETPLLEEQSSLAMAGGSAVTPFQLFDGDGRLLVVRSDLTMPIARLVATRLAHTEAPIRLRYAAPVVREQAQYMARSRQFTQLGIELIGASGADADFEVVSMAAEALNAVGVSKWRIVCGSVRPMNELLAAAGIAGSKREELLSCVHASDFVDLDAALSGVDAPENLVNAIATLPRVSGGVEALNAASAALSAAGIADGGVSELRALFEPAQKAGFADNLAVDFSVMNSFGYYTGLVFSVYADGFLTKPFAQQQVDCALNRFQNMFYQMKKNISFMVDRTMKRFCLDEIIYMETCGHATMIHTLHGDFRTNCSLTRAKEKMPDGGDFVTCGKSYYINAGYIKDVTKTEIILRGGEQIFIPIRLQKELCLLWQMKVNNNI